jgi:hypothetical protein
MPKIAVSCRFYLGHSKIAGVKRLLESADMITFGG